MLIDRTAIARLVPHSGSMCLLDAVTGWDAHAIESESRSHRDPDNPLRRGGRLAAVHAIEYGAQTAAVHGGLIARAAGRSYRPAYLAAVRDARLHVDRLDGLAGALTIGASRLDGDERAAIYRFAVRAGDIAVAEARITIVAW
jgi:predicted hotdog family 3-hydroxylacyl-ACP dehydratase